MLFKVKKFGNSAHILLPKKYLGKRVEILLPGEGKGKYLEKEEIEELIDRKIAEASAGY